MKVKSSVKLKESDKKRKDVYIVRRRGRLYLIDKKNPRRKTRQG